MVLTPQGIAQDVDYRTVYGDKYAEAVSYIAANTWMIDSLSRKGEDPAFALAIVFPELIRYAALRDQIEAMALTTLYVQYGSRYADFSVGQFQMKPSFAEHIEKDLCKPGPASAGSKCAFDTTTSRDARILRLSRLKSASGQAGYLMAFLQIMDNLYAGRAWKSDDDKLRFYATAYNLGYHAGAGKIEAGTGMKFFHTEVFDSSEKQCYAEIAVYFYHQMKGRRQQQQNQD